MKLKKLHIDNFGKLNNFDIIFNDNLNVIYEENGFGKTTLSVFIKAMFYGMEASRDNLKMDRKKYFPWQGGEYGGFIEFESGGQEYRITRHFAKTPEGDSLEIIELPSYQVFTPLKCEVGQYFLGVGEDSFQMTAFFPQLNFQTGGNEKIGSKMLGLDRFENDMACTKDALDKLKKKMSTLKKEIPKEEQITRLKYQKTQNLRVLESLEQDINATQLQIDEEKAKLQMLENDFAKLKSQADREDEIKKSKDKINEKLTVKSQELNKHYDDLNVLNSKQKEEKNHKKPLILALMVALIIGIVVSPLLFALHIISATVFASLAVVLALLILISIYYYIKLKQNGQVKNQIEKQIKDIQNQIENEKIVIENLKQMLQNIEISDFDYETELQNTQEEIFSFKLNLEKLEQAKSNSLKERDFEYEKLDELENDLSSLTTQIQEGKHKLELLSNTSKFLAQAYENVSKRFVEPVNNAFKEILKDFNLEDRQFVVDLNFKIKQLTSQGLKELDYSSQGIKDLLSLCMRFYLVGEIYKGDKPFIILDDSFVNLDDKNFEQIKKIVQKFACQYQIIYICCNNRLKI